MKILLAGAGGQVGWEIARKAAGRGFTMESRVRSELDITHPEAVQAAIRQVRPDLLINAAAYTKVDQAESEPDVAFLGNATGPGLLAECCADAGIPMIHISTDYVFDGTKGAAYSESDPISPLGIYGKSKADGEAAVREHLSRHIILRTSWVYGVHGGNFVKTMLRLGRERDHLRVVDDQSGCPTAAADIANTILTFAGRIETGDSIAWGTYHYCGKGVVTWHGFADEIFRIAGRHGYGPTPEISPIPSSEYPTPARRPPYSALDTRRITDVYDIHPRPWQESLGEVVKEIMAEFVKRFE